MQAEKADSMQSRDFIRAWQAARDIERRQLEDKRASDEADLDRPIERVSATVRQRQTIQSDRGSERKSDRESERSSPN